MSRREYRKYQGKERNASSLTPSEKRGTVKLKIRVANGSILICETDKSGKLAVLASDLYYKLGKEHSQGDEDISWADVKQGQ